MTDNTNFSQTLDEKKRRLLIQKEMQENEIIDKIEDIKSEAIDKLKIIANIGSVAVGAYLILKYLLGNKKFTLSEILPNGSFDDEKTDNKSNESGGLSPSQTHLDENSILAIFKREIAIFLVSIAKQKILELLAYLREKNTEDADFEEENNNEE